MYAVALYWDEGVVRASDVTPMTPAEGGWTAPQLTAQVFTQRGPHLLQMTPDCPPNPLYDLHHHGAIALWVDSDATTCHAFALGYISGFNAGVRRGQNYTAYFVPTSRN